MRYLLITYVRKPGGQIDEQMIFSKTIKTNDLQICNVIMDYKEEKIIKCVIESNIVPTSFEKLNEYYEKIYPNVIEQLILAQNEKFEKK